LFILIYQKKFRQYYICKALPKHFMENMRARRFNFGDAQLYRSYRLAKHARQYMIYTSYHLVRAGGFFMSRIVIDLPDEDLKVLDAIKEIQGKPRAEIIRAAISGYLQNNSADDDAEAFGIWSMGNGDGLEFQRAMRGEWPQ
jgi:hypothetical protein